MTLTNAAYNATYTWTGTNVRTLEQQALVPMLNEHPIELGLKNHEREIVSRLQSDPACLSRFRAAPPLVGSQLFPAGQAAQPGG